MADLFDRKTPKEEIQEEIGEIQRELRQRARVYPRLVHAQKLGAEQADRQIAVMRRTLGRLERIVQGMD